MEFVISRHKFCTFPCVDDWIFLMHRFLPSMNSALCSIPVMTNYSGYCYYKLLGFHVDSHK